MQKIKKPRSKKYRKWRKDHVDHIDFVTGTDGFGDYFFLEGCTSDIEIVQDLIFRLRQWVKWRRQKEKSNA